MSTKKTIQIQKNENPERLLIKAADTLMNEFKTPATFLDFLSQSLYWTDLFNKKNKEEDKMDSYFVKTMITEMVLPWINNGAKVAEVIASGLKNLENFCGYEGYHKHISSIMVGFTIDIEDAISRDEKRKYLLMFSTMFEIGDFIAQYEMELYEKREQAKRVA